MTYMKHSRFLMLLIAAVLASHCGGNGNGVEDTDVDQEVADEGELVEVEEDVDGDVDEEEMAGECGSLTTECVEGACTDLAGDPLNCGTCGNACTPGMVCSRGMCAGLCAQGFTDCSGACVDTGSNESNCGACASACAVDEVCALGKCVEGDCPAGFTQCEGRCINTLTDYDHCGGCGLSCTAPQACSGGTCQDACPVFATNCGGDCVDTAADPMNCATCFNVCTAGDYAMPTCESSVCGYECVEGAIDLGDGNCRPECIETEECNGIDDDCDDDIDEDFDCVQGADVVCETACGSDGEGVCSMTCTMPGAAECVAPLETCNGEDDDCDTLPDNGFECVAGETDECLTSCGSAGNRTCGIDCTYEAGCSIPEESCNGVDDDCDTLPDNGFDCIQGELVDCTATCGSKGTGFCSIACELPSDTDCAPPDEVCNGEDDNCDGLIDEFLWGKTGSDLRLTTHTGEDSKPTGVYDGENYAVAFASTNRRYGGLALGGDPAVMWVRITYTFTKEAAEIYVPQYVDEVNLYASDNPKIAWASSKYGLIWNYTFMEEPNYGFATITLSGTVEPVRSENFMRDPGPPDLAWTSTEYFATYKDQEEGADDWMLKYGRRNGSMIAVDWGGSGLDDASGFMEQTPLAWTGSRVGVTWEDNSTGDYEIYFMVLGADGTPVGSATRITNSVGESYAPQVAWGSSAFGLVWVDRRDGPNVIYYAGLDASGTKTTTDIRIAEIGVVPSTQPHIVHGDGEFGIVWKDPRTGNDEVYFQRVTTAGLKIGTEVQVSSNSGQSRNPFIFYDGYHYIILWDDDTAGNKDIYAIRMSCTGG